MLKLHQLVELKRLKAEYQYDIAKVGSKINKNNPEDALGTLMVMDLHDSIVSIIKNFINLYPEMDGGDANLKILMSILGKITGQTVKFCDKNDSEAIEILESIFNDYKSREGNSNDSRK